MLFYHFTSDPPKNKKQNNLTLKVLRILKIEKFTLILTVGALQSLEGWEVTGIYNTTETFIFYSEP